MDRTSSYPDTRRARSGIFIFLVTLCVFLCFTIISNADDQAVGKNEPAVQTETTQPASEEKDQTPVVQPDPADSKDPAKETVTLPPDDDQTAGTTDSSKTTPQEPATTPSGWTDESGNRRYYKEDGTFYKNGRFVIDGRGYNFDSNGYLLYGANRCSNGVYYYSDSNGVIVTNEGWVTSQDGKKYYVRRGGSLYVGTRVSIGSSRYFYAFDSTGACLTSQVYNYRGAYYYAGSTGVNQYYAKWIDLNGKRYYATRGGALCNGTRLAIGNSRYFYAFNAAAELITAQVYRYRGNYYYAGSTGVNQYYARWINYDGDLYYVTYGGTLCRSTRTSIGNARYFYAFNSNGACITSRVYGYRGNYYFAGSTGLNQYYPRWVESNGNRYYVTRGGTCMKSSLCNIGGYTYLFSRSAQLYRDQIYVTRGRYYYTDPETGRTHIKYGWIESNGKRYFARSNGQLFNDQRIYTGGNYYYMGTDCAVKTGFFHDGYTLYHADESGALNKKSGSLTFDGKSYFAKADGTLYHDTYLLTQNGYFYTDHDGVIDATKTKDFTFSEELYNLLRKKTPDYVTAIPTCRGGEYAWNWSHKGLSLVDMYEATGKTVYLNMLAEDITRILSLRDSDLGISTFGKGGEALPLWSDGGKYSYSHTYNYAYPVQTGMILMPMLMFADDVYSNPSLLADYKDLADQIIKAAGEAFAAHEKYNVSWHQYTDTTGSYWVTGNTHEVSVEGYEFIPNRMAAYVGALGLYGKLAGIQDYVDKATCSMNYLKQSIFKYDPARNTYSWSYWPELNNTEGEDISHASYTVLGLEVLHSRVGIDSFTDSDFEKMANVIGYLYQGIGSRLLVTDMIPTPNKTINYYTVANNKYYKRLPSLSLLAKYNANALTYSVDIFDSFMKNNLFSGVIHTSVLTQIAQLMLMTSKLVA